MLMHEPENEQGVVFLFSIICDCLKWKIKRIQTEFPDCFAIDEEGKEIRIEFELFTSNFILHGHDITKCDAVVAWLDDINLSRKIKVIEIKKYFPDLLPLKTDYDVRINKTLEGLRLILKGEANKENLAKLFATYHFKEREKEPLRFIARLIANGGDPYIEDNKLDLRNKNIDWKTIRYSVAKEETAMARAREILNQIGIVF